jgi:ribonuclease BN (tRNA processing enzyme)
LTFVELSTGKTTELRSVSVVPFEVRHASGAPAYALRATCDGKVISYSGDTEWTDSLVEVARGADLFICEAYFFDKVIKYHLDYDTLTRHRAELACRRLVINQMSADMLRHLSRIDVEFAEDGKELTL